VKTTKQKATEVVVYESLRHLQEKLWQDNRKCTNIPGWWFIGGHLVVGYSRRLQKEI
jgi:hypothetical protein